MRINDEFEAVEVKVVRLFRNGEPIRDHRGHPMDYESFDDALHVAANWEKYQSPSYEEIRAMSNEELICRASGLPYNPIPKTDEPRPWYKRLFGE